MTESAKLKKATYHLWTFTTSKLIAAFGGQVYAFAISFYILQMTGSAMSFATNIICNILPRTLLAPFAGYVADRYPRKTIIIAAQIATTLTVGGLLTYTLMVGLSLPAIYVTTVLLAITGTFSSVTFTSSITGLVDENRIQKAMSLNQMALSFAAIGSPAVGGLLYGFVSMPVILLAFIVASAIAVLLESTMDFELFAKRQIVEEDVRPSMFDSMKEGIQYIRKESIILSIIWISFVINFLFGAFQVGYAYILIEQFKMPSIHFGMTEGALALGMFLFSIYFSIRKEVRFPLLVAKWAIIALGIVMGLIAIPLMTPFPYNGLFAYYATMLFLFGSISMIINTPLQVMLLKRIDDDYKGRVFSILEAMSMALMPIGMVLFGMLYDHVPGQWILITSSIILVGVVLWMARPSVLRLAHPELRSSQNPSHMID